MTGYCPLREFAKFFYNSPAWERCREEYAKRQGYLCERCRQRGIIRTGEIVHHKIFLNPQNIHEPGITLNPDNLMLVCRDCHAALHKPEKRYKVDELGRIKIIE